MPAEMVLEQIGREPAMREAVPEPSEPPEPVVEETTPEPVLEEEHTPEPPAPEIPTVPEPAPKKEADLLKQKQNPQHQKCKQ